MVFALIVHFPIQAQIDNNGCLANGFGIDADLRSGLIQFGNGTPASGSDDWFLGATGRGIIDESDAATIQALLQFPTSNNNTFEARMSEPVFSINAGEFWIDAVYARDHFGGTGFTDFTAYATSSKNAQDPAVWGTGPTNVLGKNDLIDVAGYMRRDVPDPIAFPVPPAAGGQMINYLRGDLWFYGLIIRAEPGGDAYMDFEFFVEDLNYNSTSHKFNSGGPELGHTSFLFDNTGKITRLGDAIFNVSLIGGGTNPNVELRIWMSAALHASIRNNPSAYPDLPFTLEVEFDGAFNGAPYGYARITPKFAEQACGIVNLAGQNPTVAPWGHRGTKANIYLNNTQTHADYAFAEVAFNMSLYGIDNTFIDGGDLCSFPYQTFITKTRSSGSFTSALKDFGGPFDWGKPAVLAVTAGTLSCLNTTTTVSATPARPDLTYNWTTVDGNIVSGANTATITVDKPGTYVLEATLSTGCALPLSSAVVTRVSGQPPFSAATATGNVACTPTSGAVTLATVGGTLPFSYSWSNGNSTQNLSSVAAGAYTVTVTDAVGCTITAAATVTAATPMTLTSTINDVTCNGLRNGNIAVTVSGGSSPFSYLWSTGNTLATLSNVAAGAYTITVTDANACTATATYTITQPTAIVATLSKTDDTDSDPLLGTGSISLSGPTGGSPGFGYQWTGPHGFTSTDTNLSSLDYGLYSLTITDANACTFTSSIFIYEPEVCNDGIDNDGDGLTDCLDSDCTPNTPTALLNPPICVDEEFIVYTATSIYNIITPTLGQNEFVWTIPPGSTIWSPGMPPTLASPPYGDTINVKYSTTQGGTVCVQVRINTCLSSPICVEVVCNRIPDSPAQITVD